MFDQFWKHGMVRRAIDQKKISFSTVNIRDFATGRHQVTDDRPYGGGSGMIMKPEPLAAAIRLAKKQTPLSKTILLSPQGVKFNQDIAGTLAALDGIVFVCGRYEGIDERICNTFIDFEISIGDLILTGGELGAMVIIDALTRLIPGVLGGADSAEKDTFSNKLVKYAQFTRPRVFEGSEVPDVLMSGNHLEIARWRLETSLKRTFLKRKDLLENKKMDENEIKILKQWCIDIENIIHSQSLHGSDALSGS